MKTAQVYKQYGFPSGANGNIGNLLHEHIPALLKLF